MIYSMTGFGKTICDFGNLKLNIEIKSLNSKQLDINCKLPFDLRTKEFAIRNIISSQLIRGKIDCLFLLEQDNATGSADIDMELFEYYYDKIKNIADSKGLENSDRLMLSVLKMPDVITSAKIDLNEETWRSIEKALLDALGLCRKFRAQEGKSLSEDIENRTKKIMTLLDSIPAFETERINVIRDRISENMAEFIDKKNVDENRLEQEMIYYLEKLDISEEKNRLANHCNYFLETMNEDAEVGKKLNFISQEMGREINTLGSKANNADIQRIVIQMKDELEKIKEQVLNIL